MPTAEELEQLRAYGTALLGSGQTPAPESGNPYAYVSPLSIVTRGLQALQGRSALDLASRGRRANREALSESQAGVTPVAPPPVVPPAPGGNQPVAPPVNQPAPDTNLSSIPWGQPNAPRPIRLNNPGAIEFGPFAQQHGAIGSDGRFARFANPEAGFRAMEALLTTYLRRGLATPRQIIGRWAPTSDGNNVSSYAANVARIMGITPDTRLTAAHIPQLALAMAQHESGMPVTRASTPQAVAPQAGAQVSTRRVSTLPLSATGIAQTGDNQPQAPDDGLMRLGGPEIAEADIPSTGEAPIPTLSPELSSGPELPPEQQLNLTRPPVAPVSPGAAPESPGYVGGRPSEIPPGVPERIPPSPALQSIIAQLRNPTAGHSDEQFNELLKRYQELSAPQSVQTAFGTATYNPLTGERMTFVPSAQRRTATFPGGSIEQDVIWDQGALRTVPRAGPVTGVSAAPGTAGGPGAPQLRPSLRSFPLSGDPAELSEWGMEAQSLGTTSANRAGTLAQRIERAEAQGLEAETNLRTLSRIRTATLASANARWTGTRASAWQQQISTFLHNFDPNNSMSLPQLQALPWNELLGKLNAYLAAQATSAISARGTNFEFGTFLQQNPNIVQTPQGTQMMIDYLEQERKREVAIGRMAQTLAEQGPQAYGRLPRMIADYDRRNPVYITIPRGVGGHPNARRVTTQQIPNVGDMKPDGSGSYTAAEVREIIQALPEGVWFINPRTNNIVPRSPVARSTAPVAPAPAPVNPAPAPVNPAPAPVAPTSTPPAPGKSWYQMNGPEMLRRLLGN